MTDLTPMPAPHSAAGTWRNAYGSVLRLAVHGGRLVGQYHSSTGASGCYAVSGQHCDAVLPGNGRPLALAIAWQALDHAVADPSWHWVSGLCGQLLWLDGEEVLLLSHLLVASSALPGRAAPGTYLDQLRYQRVDGRPWMPAQAASAVADARDALAGHWQAPDGAVLQLQVQHASGQMPAQVHGHGVIGNARWDVRGYTDARAHAAGIPRQSLALVAHRPGGAGVACLAGTLAHGRLQLLAVTASATAAGTRYLQAQIAPLSFSR